MMETNKLAAQLLEFASREFGNHGCNDFDLEILIPDKDERKKFVAGFHAWNGDPEEIKNYSRNEDWRWCLGDWTIMRYVAHLLKSRDSEGHAGRL